MSSFYHTASFHALFWYEYFNNQGMGPVPGPNIKRDLERDKASRPEVTETRTGTDPGPGYGPVTGPAPETFSALWLSFDI